MPFCFSCGSEVSPDVQFCSKCGKSLIKEQASGNETVSKKRSRWWYLLPIFLSWVGGLIMYFVIRVDDRKMAKNGLILGIILTVIPAIIMLMGILSYTFTQPFFK